jgi:predicted S18 family serine protease
LRRPTLIAVLAVGALAACSKTEDGQIQVQVPDVDVKVGRDTVTVPTPNLPNVDVGTGRDTVTTPTVGTKRTEVQRPTVDVKRP